MIVYDHKFGATSLKNLYGVKLDLVAVAQRAIQLCRFDGTVVSGGGMRTQAQANANVARGTGIANSLHIKQADGWGHAIDLIPLTPGAGIDWKNLTAFKAMASAVKYASAELLIPIRQGCDWNMNGVFNEAREYDWAHFEQPPPRHRQAALDEMHRFRVEVGLSEPYISPEEDTEDTMAEFWCPHCDKPLSITKG